MNETSWVRPWAFVKGHLNRKPMDVDDRRWTSMVALWSLTCISICSPTLNGFGVNAVDKDIEPQGAFKVVSPDSIFATTLTTFISVSRRCGRHPCLICKGQVRLCRNEESEDSNVQGELPLTPVHA